MKWNELNISSQWKVIETHVTDYTAFSWMDEKNLKGWLLSLLTL